MISWFTRITFTCNHCGVRQRIPLRRIHFFERFNELGDGQAVLIACPTCLQGLQIPSTYRTHTGYVVNIDPEEPPKNAVIHAHYC
jgi:RNase P subunit RPR2